MTDSVDRDPARDALAGLAREAFDDAHVFEAPERAEELFLAKLRESERLTFAAARVGGLDVLGSTIRSILVGRLGWGSR